MNRTIRVGGISFDVGLTLAIIVTTVVPMLDYYNHRITGVRAYDRFLYYFVVPMALILLVYRQRPSDHGLRLGRWREGLLWTVGTVAVMVLVLWFFTRLPAVQSYYSEKAPEGVFRIIAHSGIELFGWEFIWRGWLLFLLARYVGPGPAIFLQAVPFAFMHLGKPELETISTIFGGAGFGFVAWRTQSMLYPWLIHWFMLSFTTLIAAGWFG